jgi:hypothetical protein
MRIVTVLVFGLLIAVSAAHAQSTIAPTAQAREPLPRSGRPETPVRALIFFGGDMSTKPATFSQSVTERVNLEDARFTSTYAGKAAIGFGAAATVRVWRPLGIRVGFSRFAHETSAAFSGAVPHPFFFSTPRSVSGEANDLPRQEATIDLQLAGIFQLNRSLIASVSAGPSLVMLNRHLIADYNYSEIYPYDTVIGVEPASTRVSGSKLGVGAGGSLTMLLTRVVGVSGQVQFVRANVPVGLPSEASIRAGGLRGSLGVGLKF